MVIPILDGLVFSQVVKRDPLSEHVIGLRADMNKVTPRPKDPSGRAQWLLDFSQSDFPNLSGEERRRWGTELGEFIGVMSHDPKRPDLTLGQQYVDQVWQALQRLLQSIVKEDHVWSQTVEATLTICQKGGIVTTVTELYSELRSDPFEMETYAAILFAQLDGPLAICANRACNRAFIKSRRQTYCTVRCRDTVNKRAYRKRSRQPHN